jgi:hypothetical protein
MLGRFCGDDMRLDIEFYDRNGNPTTDYVQGNPMIWIEIAVDAPIPDEAKGSYQVTFAKELALVDTGASHTMVCPDLTVGKTPRGVATPLQTATGIGTSPAFLSVVRIQPFDVPHFTLSGSSDLGGIRALIGRDILSHYRLVFDITGREFYLESAGGTPPPLPNPTELADPA